MNVGTPFITNAKASELMQPGDRALHHPAHLTQALILIGATTRQKRLNALHMQHHFSRGGVIRLVGDDCVRSSPRGADLAAHGRNRVDQFKQLRAVVDVRRRDRCDQRRAARLCNDMVFRAGFSAIRGVRAGVFAPPRQRERFRSRPQHATSR